MLHRRKRLPAPKRRESLWKTRRTTIRYLLYFLMGLLLGSIAAVLCGADSIPFRIMVNQLTAERGLWVMWRESLLFSAILLLYLMISARCLWGMGMIPMVPLVFGAGQGTAMTFLLILLGWKGLAYLLPGFILPKTVQLAAVILLCNTAQTGCERLSGGENSRQTLLWLAGAFLLAFGGLLQTVFRLKFTF